MNIRYTIALFTSALLLNACQESSVNNNAVTETNPDSLISSVPDTITISKDSTEKIWKELTDKLEPVKIPCKIECATINDSFQIELSATQVKQLLPKEAITQKDPIVSALHTLEENNTIVGTFYYIQYAVLYDKLKDIRCQVILVLYDDKGRYTDYRTLAIEEYGTGYSKIKSLNEILYLYSTEKETIETTITTYSIANIRSFENVNEVHFSSRGSQDEYEKNTMLIEKLMK
jgi:hypothetical protein